MKIYRRVGSENFIIKFDVVELLFRAGGLSCSPGRNTIINELI
ncbi:MAG: hypothetical protein V1897_06005 [Pseudomonadota bacterium]